MHEDIQRVCEEFISTRSIIVERYIIEEAIEFCITYMSEVDAISVPRSRYEGRQEGKGTRVVRIVRKDRQQVLQAHLYILNNIDDDLPYIRVNEKWLLNEHNDLFILFCRQTLSLKHLHYLERKLCHQLLLNEISIQT